jgi:hypothetical protein
MADQGRRDKALGNNQWSALDLVLLVELSSTKPSPIVLDVYCYFENCEDCWTFLRPIHACFGSLRYVFPSSFLFHRLPHSGTTDDQHFFGFSFLPRSTFAANCSHRISPNFVLLLTF